MLWSLKQKRNNWTKLSPHHHSGKLQAHENTSYFPLGLVMIFVGLSLTAATAAADPWTRPGPASGSIGISGTMPGKPPSIGAKITSPASGQRFSTSPVTIKGTCLKNTLVEIFKNDIFAGSTLCTEQGAFSLEVDLLIGKNDLVARVYDDLNQAGPDSNIVTVYYDALPAQADPIQTLDFGGPQLLINTDAVFRGVFPEEDMPMPIDIIGGTAPYAISIQWGDLTNSVVSRRDNQSFTLTHKYKKAGTYQISVQGSDSQGRVAFITVASIVNGQPPVEATAATTTSPTNRLLLLWPLYTSAVAVLVSFWLGERREKSVLSHRGLLLQPAPVAMRKAAPKKIA